MANKFFNSASVVEALKTKGYNVEVKEIVRNGVVKVGYIFLDADGNAKPTLYLDEDAPSEPSEAADYLINIFRNARSCNLDASSIADWSKVKDNLILSICGAGKEKVPCKNVLDLDVFARVDVNNFVGGGTVKVTEELLKAWGKSLDEVLEVAAENIRKNVVALNIASMLFGCAEAEELDLDDLEIPMIVMTNDSKCLGASQMLNAEALEKVAKQFDSDLFILPSSIHEIIVIPEAVAGDVDDLFAMVREVNGTVVSPEEVLTDSVYKFERKEKRLTLAK